MAPLRKATHGLAVNVKEWTTSIFYPYPGGSEYEHWFNFPFFTEPYPEKDWNPVNRDGIWTAQVKTMPSAYRDSQVAHNRGFRYVRLVAE